MRLGGETRGRAGDVWDHFQIAVWGQVDVKSIATKPDMLRLWCHELSRVFHDRLINAEDRKWFFDLLDSKLDSEFETSWQEVAPTGFLLYGDYVDPAADPRTYV